MQFFFDNSSLLRFTPNMRVMRELNSNVAEFLTYLVKEIALYKSLTITQPATLMKPTAHECALKPQIAA